MKRYLVFAYERYYPSGGLSDLIGDFDSLKEAKSSIKQHITKDFIDIFDQEVNDYILEDFIDLQKEKMWNKDE